jgi:rare lipoprotein A
MRLRFHRWQGIAAALVAATSILAGCGSAPQPIPPVADAAGNRQPAARSPGAQSLPVLPPAGSGRGGYYKDDGPGDAPPDGLYDIPDAEPKVEPYTQRGNRPYVVFGKSYTPFTDGRPFRQRGIGSWYGKKFHGQKTSSGEVYDMYKMTAAHPTLPLPSYVRVTNVSNGKQVIVRVNDRGPFHSSRIIDLSYTAALKLGYIAKGSAELEVERLLPDEIARINSSRQTGQDNSGELPPASSAQPASPAVDAMPVQMPSIVISNIGGTEQAAVQPIASIVPVGAAAGGFYLQLGAYGNPANAENVRSRLAESWSAALPPIEIVQNGALYRVYSGPFASRSDADSAARQVQAASATLPVIVQR